MKVKFKIRKGDTVSVRSGKDRGKTGEVLKVLTQEMKVLVKGINVCQKHKKPTQFSVGAIEQKEMPIHISNVSLLDPLSGKPTKVGYKVSEDGSKKRFAKASGKFL
jgi:large subunit ribosomal protein L24